MSMTLRQPLALHQQHLCLARVYNLSSANAFVRFKSSKSKASKASSSPPAAKSPPPSPAPAPTPAPTPSATAASSTTSESSESLTWPEYLRIRANKRKWEMATTIPSTLFAFAGALGYFGNLETDPTKPIFGIDPMFFYGFSSVGIGGLGYLVGPSIGSTCWRLTHRRIMPLYEARDKEFYRHLVNNRVDPSAQSTSNPVPDYYGEKIGSLQGYRQWLRDQARYRRKARWLDEKDLAA
ncbi:Pam17-domain-containing protein [Punctularia strigosozonata HHB-11173 SS5]|uniref:Pam17-domain-containing protein n=1 Tax=Punctularia strigosozonata (strain HHB-11173) TaxID=741275 RepID=UPI000441728F|nr:Pam17-domain-containing protein [Punctularia strigosozonata HHB-11173 SS5]EIN07070.1 Pam17-domain-containing protein [Punctularia strigosozonata HHB-11173 SS5]